MLEQIGACRTAIFDKTGTLRYGEPKLTDQLIAPGFLQPEVLTLAASLVSIVTLPNIKQRPALPRFERSPTDPFLRQLDASRKKWVIIIDDSGQPGWVLDVDQFLRRDVLFNNAALDLEVYWHRPVIVSDMNTRLDDVMGRLKVRQKHPEDDVIDNDLILVWGKQKRIITGSDILGRLLRGISIEEAN